MQNLGLLSLQQVLDMFFLPAVNEKMYWTIHCNQEELKRRHDFYTTFMTPRK